MKLYKLHVPVKNRIPVVASLPHSGIRIPRNVRRLFKQGFPPILTPVDWYLDTLYHFLPELGISVIQAVYSRYVVNLNRALKEPLFGPEGKCVVPENTCFRQPLYDNEPPRDEVEERIKRYYLPYHRHLARILDEMVVDFGSVYLLDLHSYYWGPEVDVCLGNVNDTTCSEALIGSFEKAFLGQDFAVVRNDKWIGGYITRHYGSMDNIEALQIELRFPAYLERGTFEDGEVPEWDSDKFRNARDRLQRVYTGVVNNLFPL